MHTVICLGTVRPLSMVGSSMQGKMGQLKVSDALCLVLSVMHDVVTSSSEFETYCMPLNFLISLAGVD